MGVLSLPSGKPFLAQSLKQRRLFKRISAIEGKADVARTGSDVRVDPKRTRRIGTEASPLRSGWDCSSNVFDPISDCAGSLLLMRWESNIRYTQRSPASLTKRRVEFRQPFRENLASSKT